MNLAPVFSHPDSARQELPAPCAEALMRVRLALFGAEVIDFTIGPEQAADECDDPGSFTSYPVGFVRDPDPVWEDAGSSRQFDPDS